MSVTGDVLAACAAAVLSGGGVGAFASLYAAKRKVPAERDSIAVAGSENAVLAIERSLAAETRRADRAEREVVRLQDLVSERDARITALEHRLDDVQASLDQARGDLASLIADVRKEGHGQ
jgi:predicted  nucleic acid-binding Zn-ribbon protein